MTKAGRSVVGESSCEGRAAASRRPANSGAPALRSRLMAQLCALAACVLGIVPALSSQGRSGGSEGEKTEGAMRRKTSVRASRIDAICRGALPANAEELGALQQRIKDVWKKARAATVTLGGAAGVVIPGGYVLTAGHVARSPGRRVTMRLSDGRRISGETLGGNESTDTGLVRIRTEGEFPHLEIADSSKLKRGAWVVMLGFPGSRQNEGPPLRFGRVTKNPSIGYLVSDCRMCSGDSGGPLVDLFGRVVGINSRISRDLSKNMHVSSATILREWDAMMRSEWVGTRRASAYLGVEQRAEDGGARVLRVMEDSAASRAGLRSGDLITRIEERSVGQRSTLPNVLRRFRAGQRARLHVKRGQEDLVLRARFGRREN